MIKQLKIKIVRISTVWLLKTTKKKPKISFLMAIMAKYPTYNNFS